MTDATPTIDCQVHAYERDSPERPWRAVLAGPDEVTGDDMVRAMDAVGVDGALLVSPYTLYGYDPSYVLGVYDRHPDRFGLIKPFDPQSESVADEVAEWTARPGVVGARVMLSYEQTDDHQDGLDRILGGGRVAPACPSMCSVGDRFRSSASSRGDIRTRSSWSITSVCGSRSSLRRRRIRGAMSMRCSRWRRSSMSR